MVLFVIVNAFSFFFLRFYFFCLGINYQRDTIDYSAPICMPAASHI